VSDRSIRNLVNLQEFGSTARVLNLLSVWKSHRDTPEWAAAPLFHTPALNRSLIIKHRLRRDELDLFRSRRQVATKIVVPIDTEDLRAGGRFIFVGQKQFEASMREHFGVSVDDRDTETLTLLDQLPSLDPFLLREQLRRHDIDPARCYFELTDADLKKMFSFVESEIRPLVTMSLQGASANSGAATANLVAKILSNADGNEMQPLRLTLQLAPNDYAEGVFCWKGFLYYKWSLATIMKDVRSVADEIATIKPLGSVDSDTRAYIERSRAVLRRQIMKTCEIVIGTLRVYDEAYANLTENGRPAAFREFLLDAPHMFTLLGEQVGAVQHIVSFWRFRFRDGHGKIGPDELVDILMDFEASLASRDDAPRQLLRL
jgi:hypothetical protein